MKNKDDSDYYKRINKKLLAYRKLAASDKKRYRLPVKALHNRSLKSQNLFWLYLVNNYSPHNSDNEDPDDENS